MREAGGSSTPIEINDLSCNYFGVKQYCMLRKAKKSFNTSFVQLIWPIETDTLAMKSTRLVSYHTLHHNIELDPNDARPQSDNFFANWI